MDGKTNVSVVIPDDLLVTIKDQAKKMSMPYSTYIRMACVEYIEKHAKKRK